ncbi:MAG: hypothetical protein A2W26_01315 [Acidobacteria bacterium RBG_16_64_8]|nr:MAG: hypothetical protein A2W26_01315 [Acidobacteria bacterium RBG_16_64_8]
MGKLVGDEETKDLQQEDAEMMKRLQEQLQSLTVSDHLLYMMQSLSGLAVGRMGLTADTVERRDLDQARLAVDAFKALMELIERARPAEEMAAHRSMLAQLQLAYVGALEGGAPPEPPEHEQPENEGRTD